MEPCLQHGDLNCTVGGWLQGRDEFCVALILYGDSSPKSSFCAVVQAVVFKKKAGGSLPSVYLPAARSFSFKMVLVSCP